MSEPEPNPPEEYCLRLIRQTLPEKFAQFTGGLPDFGAWFLESREGDHLKLFLFGSFSNNGLERLQHIFEGARSVDVRLFDFSGGSGIVSDLFCSLLAGIGRTNVRVHVTGKCCSAGVDILCHSSHVSADANAELMVHGSNLVFVVTKDCCPHGQRTLAELAEDMNTFYEAAWRRLRLRVADPALLLDGNDHWLDATTAVSHGLIDEIL